MRIWSPQIAELLVVYYHHGHRRRFLLQFLFPIVCEPIRTTVLTPRTPPPSLVWSDRLARYVTRVLNEALSHPLALRHVQRPSQLYVAGTRTEK